MQTGPELYYSAIIFDLDGTLIDSAPGIEYALAEAIHQVIPDKQINSDNLRQCIGPPVREVVRNIFPEVSQYETEQIESCFRPVYDDIGWKKTIVYPRVIEVLSELITRGISCFIVTNKPYTPTRQILAHFGLEPFFKQVLSLNKNDPNLRSKEAMIQYLLEKHSLSPTHSLVVGDSSLDAIAADQNDLPFAAVLYGYGEIYQFNHFPTVGKLNQPFDLLEIVHGV
jgi:phosphoglycolate phosphatase